MLSAWNQSWPNFYAYSLIMNWNMIFFFIDLKYYASLNQNSSSFVLEQKSVQKRALDDPKKLSKSISLEKSALTNLCACQIC